MKTVIRSAEVYRHGALERSDVVIEGEKIRSVSPAASGQFEQEVDGRGLHLFPGLIDVHVHFRDPGLEHKEGWLNGSRAAARGGVSCVFEIQNNPPLSVDAARLQERHRRASQGIVDFGCFGNLIPQSLPKLREMAPLMPSLKLFMGGSTGMDGIPDRKLLKELFQSAVDAGCWIVAHCEDERILLENKSKAANATALDHHRLRPPEAEIRSIETALELAEETKAIVHVFHVSTGRGAQLIGAAKKRGLPVTASVSPHHLIFTWEDAKRLGNFLKVNPAVQSAQDREILREAVRSGDIDTIATDHAPHLREEKERSYQDAPSGIASVEFLLPLVLSLVEEKAFSLSRAIDAMSCAPAQAFAIQGKGRIEPGYDADLVLIDLSSRHRIEEKEIISRAQSSPYLGREICALPTSTWVRGKRVWDGASFLQQGWGKPVRYSR